MYALRWSALASASATVFTGLTGAMNYKTQMKEYESKQKKPATMHTSEDSSYALERKKASAFNRFFMRNGVSKILDVSVKPPYLICSSHITRPGSTSTLTLLSYVASSSTLSSLTATNRRELSLKTRRKAI